MQPGGDHELQRHADLQCISLSVLLCLPIQFVHLQPTPLSLGQQYGYSVAKPPQSQYDCDVDDPYPQWPHGIPVLLHALSVKNWDADSSPHIDPIIIQVPFTFTHGHWERDPLCPFIQHILYPLWFYVCFTHSFVPHPDHYVDMAQCEPQPLALNQCLQDMHNLCHSHAKLRPHINIHLQPHPHANPHRDYLFHNPKPLRISQQGGHLVCQWSQCHWLHHDLTVRFHVSFGDQDGNPQLRPDAHSLFHGHLQPEHQLLAVRV